MKVAAIKYRVIDNTTSQICCVIAVRKSETNNLPSAIAEKFVHSLEHASHKAGSIHMWEEAEFDFGEGEEVRLVEYMQRLSDLS